MTDFLIAPKNVNCNLGWTCNRVHKFFNFFVDGLYWYSERRGIHVYIIGAPYLDYTKNQKIEDLGVLVQDAIEKGEVDSVEVHGFATLVAVTETSLYLWTDADDYRPIYIKKSPALSVASRIHNFSYLQERKMEVDFSVAEFSLIFGFQPFDSTIVKGVLKSKVNIVYQLDERGGVDELGVIKSPKPHKYTSSIDESIFKLHNHLSESIKSLSHIDGKAGVLLGGFDSALIVALAVKAGIEVETFSFYYSESSYNQDKINELTEMYNVKHHWIPITEQIVKEGLDGYSASYSVPSNWPHYIIQSDYLCKKISQLGFKLVLTGDGCDGLFQGYPQLYRSAKMHNEGKSIVFLSSLVRRLVDSEIFERNLGHVYRLIMRVYRNAQMKNPEKTYLMYRVCDESSVARLRGKSVINVEHNIQEKVARIASGLNDISYTKLAYQGRSNMGPNRTKINGVIDNNNLHLFSPYMHWKVKEFVSSLPEEFFRPESESTLDDIGKYILVKMAEEYDLLTKDIIHQPKKAAVDAPMDDWYERELKPYVLEKIDSSNFVVSKKFARALANPKAAEKIYRKYFSADSITSHMLSLILTIISFERD